MKIKSLCLVVVFSLLLSGCAGKPYVIGYDIIKSPAPPPKLGKVSILPFVDERPRQERKGVKGKLLAFSSKDAHFSKSAAQAIEEILAEELSNAGFAVVEESENPTYEISGKVLHFQAIMSPAKVTLLPYLGPLSTLWAKDDFTIALSVYIKMVKLREEAIIERTFDVSQDMKLPTGLLSLARYSRGFNYKLKLLDEALKDVMWQIREEIVAKVKK